MSQRSLCNLTPLGQHRNGVALSPFAPGSQIAVPLTRDSCGSQLRRQDNRTTSIPEGCWGVTESRISSPGSYLHKRSRPDQRYGPLCRVCDARTMATSSLGIMTMIIVFCSVPTSVIICMRLHFDQSTQITLQF